MVIAFFGAPGPLELLILGCFCLGIFATIVVIALVVFLQGRDRDLEFRGEYYYELPGREAWEPPSKDDRMIATLCHLAAVCMFVVPLGNIFGPLLVWLLKRDQHPFIDDQGKESLNFQLTMVIATVVLVCTLVGILLVPVLIILNLVLIIMATLKANEGVAYRYPFSLRLVK